MTCTICAHIVVKPVVISNEHTLAHCINVQERRRDGAHLCVRHILLAEQIDDAVDLIARHLLIPQSVKNRQSELRLLRDLRR
jgi:hypothetical protein